MSDDGALHARDQRILAFPSFSPLDDPLLCLQLLAGNPKRFPNLTLYATHSLHCH